MWRVSIDDRFAFNDGIGSLQKRFERRRINLVGIGLGPSDFDWAGCGSGIGLAIHGPGHSVRLRTDSGYLTKNVG